MTDKVKPEESTAKQLSPLWGLVVVLFGGLFAVGCGVYVSHDATPMFGLILVLLTMRFILGAPENMMNILGGVVGVIEIFIGVGVLFTHDWTALIMLLIPLVASFWGSLAD